MKRKLLMPFALSLLLVAGCANQENEPALEYKDIPIYVCSASGADEQGVIDLTKQEKQTVRLAFLPSEPFLPYIRLSDGFRIFLSNMDKYLQKETSTADAYSITLANGENRYSFSFNRKDKEIAISGDIASLSSEFSGDVSSNALDAKFDEAVIQGDAKKPYALSYKNTGFQTHAKDNSLFVPLSLASSILKRQIGYGLFFDYQSVFAFSDSLFVPKARFNDGTGTPLTLAQRMAKTIEKNQLKEMPLSLRQNNRDALTFILENYYGLRYSLGIKSMYDYLASTSYYENLMADDPLTRANALQQLLHRFQDGHTVLVSSAQAWSEKASQDIPQSLREERFGIEEALKNAKEKVYKEEGIKTTDVRYSKDGKTAVVPLLKFEAHESALDPKTRKPTATEAEILAADTYFQTKKALTEVKNKGGVERVIIDMSINNGGDSNTMAKLLALISKDNKGTLYFHDMLTEAVKSVNARLDMNQDGVVDEKDKTFGKDFTFYLLTSPCAFSCGTAYPFLASHSGFAKIIGVNPGGGECALGTDTLPNGQSFAHSSMLRICYPTKDGLLYDEAGVNIDTEFRYDQFYDLENMVKELSEDEKDE